MSPRQPDDGANVRHDIESVLAESNRLLRISDNPVAQVLLNTNPWTGAIATLLSAESARRQEIRLRYFLVEVVRDIEMLRDQQAAKIDDEFVQSDEFVGIVVDIMSEAARSADDRHLDYLRKFLSGATLARRPDATWLDLFRRYVGRLSGIHVHVLSEIYRRQKGIPASDRLGRKRLKNVPVCLDSLKTVASGPILTRVALVDLANLGLLVDWVTAAGAGTIQDCYSLTRNGMLFMRFLESDWPNLPTVQPID